METKKIGQTEFNVEGVKKLGLKRFCEVYKHFLKDPEKSYEDITGEKQQTENGNDTTIQNKRKHGKKKFDVSEQDGNGGQGEAGEDFSS